jgi:shikimate dehydrogenase
MAFRRLLNPNDVFQIEDLESWPADGTWLAVLGHPIKHSISPAMHNAALAELAKAAPQFSTWQYVRFEVPPEQLPHALKALHAKRFKGLNLTVPHKVIAFTEVERVDRAAQPIGAVNTLRWTDTGWDGFNTDGYGLASGLKEDLGADLTGAHVILLGAGGAARGAAVECIERGCASLSIANRTAANLDELLADLKPLARTTRLLGFSPQHPPADLPRGAWVVNATSAGLRPDDPLPIDLEKLPAPAGVYDMIYNPARTALLKKASELKIPAANGLSMLIHQGARALAIWSEAAVPVHAMRAAAVAAMAKA